MSLSVDALIASFSSSSRTYRRRSKIESTPYLIIFYLCPRITMLRSHDAHRRLELVGLAVDFFHNLPQLTVHQLSENDPHSLVYQLPFNLLFRECIALRIKNRHREELVLINDRNMLGRRGPACYDLIAWRARNTAGAEHVLKLMHAKGAGARCVWRNCLTMIGQTMIRLLSSFFPFGEHRHRIPVDFV